MPENNAALVNISYSNSLVDVDTVCLFRARLDKFLMHQDVKYDFMADLMMMMMMMMMMKLPILTCAEKLES